MKYYVDGVLLEDQVIINELNAYNWKNKAEDISKDRPSGFYVNISNCVGYLQNNYIVEKINLPKKYINLLPIPAHGTHDMIDFLRQLKTSLQKHREEKKEFSVIDFIDAK